MTVSNAGNSRSMQADENVHDVPHAVCDEVHCRHRRLLGVTRHVTRDQRQEADKRRGAGLREVVARQSSPIIV